MTDREGSQGGYNLSGDFRGSILNFESSLSGEQRIAARNPAFDVTPHRYVTGIVTEAGIVYPPFGKNLRAAVEKG